MKEELFKSRNGEQDRLSPLINFVIDRSLGVGIKDGGGRDLPSLEKVAM